MSAYYNEIDPYAAQWLRNLIEAGHIAPGYVDERSIEDVYPSDLRGFTQCHFFAGIGVWSHALRSAGWSDDRPVWTGSCPCQPFSAAGAGAGFDDQRHLWPAFFHLIEQCRPASVLGEQVASKDANPWIDLVQTDLEAVEYGVGAIAFPSAGIGAPHIRDRLYWVANTGRAGLDQRVGQSRVSGQPPAAIEGEASERSSLLPIVGVGNTSGERWVGRQGLPAGGIDDGSHAGRLESDDGSLGVGKTGNVSRPAGPTNGLWADADWLFCRDGKWRPVEPGTFPLAHGASSRVGRLRAYGNAINAKAAQAFIECMMEAA